jgi:hypothetical protein
MNDLTQMTPAAARHLREIAEGWETYGPALKAWAALDGGMTWKAVNGADYLCRYRQDPETGKKKFTSLGRRSAETEKIYADFIDRRDAAKATVIAGRDRMATAGRVAKAYGLARMPTATAEILRALWLRSLTDDLAAFGGTALFAYELETGVLAPADLVRDDHLLVVRMRADLPIEDFVLAYESVNRGRTQVTERRSRIHIKTPGGTALEILNSEAVLARIDDQEQTEIIEAAFSLPLVRGLTIARDGKPVEYRVFDPRLYAMASAVMAEGDPLWNGRAEFAADLVRERWKEPFEPGQEAAFPPLRAGSSIDDSRLYGP